MILYENPNLEIDIIIFNQVRTRKEFYFFFSFLREL